MTTTTLDAHADRLVPAHGGAVRSGASAFHAVTWLVWAIAAAASIHLAPNPLAVAVVVGIAWLVVQAHRVEGPLARAFPLLLAVGVLFGAVKVVLTVLTTHGIGDPIVRLPEVTLPTLLGGFTVGGTVEDLVLAQAVAEAFAIAGIMGAFGAFNACVSHDELVRTLPRAFHEAGVVLTVGLAFVPATVASVRQAQESDRARTGGAVARRGRLVRLAVPLLERGMERAVLLSESMESRGFASGPPTTSDRWAGALALGGSLALGAALLALVGHASVVAVAAGALGGLGLVAAVALASRSANRSRYRPRPMRAVDAAVMVASLAAPAAIVLLGVLDVPHRRWPGDVLGVPTIDPRLLLALLVLATPAAVPAPRTEPT